MTGLGQLMRPVAERLLGEPNKRLSKGNRLRFGRRGSLAVDLLKGVWFDHEAGHGGGPLGLIRRERHCDEEGAIAWLRSEGFLDSQDFSRIKHEVAAYDYVAENGTLLYQVIKYEPKDFKQRRPNGNGGWTWKLGNVRRVLYRLPELVEAIALKHTVLIVEGEKDADSARALGLSATCNPGGASNWRADYNQVFRGADVVLIPDNDEAGWKHINDVGAHLQGIAARIRVRMLPGNAKDISDWIAAGGTREQLDQLIEVAPDWVAPAVDTEDKTNKAKATTQEDELLDELARMRPGVEFGKQRRKLAKDLGVGREDIDEEIKARRSRLDSEKEVAPLYGHWIIDPWPEVADGDALLRDIIQRIRKHVVCSHDAAFAAALWVMMAWVHDEVATHSPILNVTSVEPDSGKSTTLGILAFLMPRCIASVEASEGALFRAIKRWQPSFAIDEFDSVLASDEKAPLRSIINSGHTRGQGVLRCVEPNWVPELFPTFAPKAIGMRGRKLPDTTLSRCVIIELQRKKKSEKVERFLNQDDEGLKQLRSRLARWSADNEDALRGIAPRMPDGFENRRGDNWRLQLAIADLCGDDWGDKAREAAIRLEGAVDVASIGVRLLADCKRIHDTDTDRDKCILSATLVAKLNEDEEGPWVVWSKGKGLTQNGLATLLGGGGGRGRGSRGGFGIYSETVHTKAGVHGRGYKWSRFLDAWARYLPDENSPNRPEEAE